jgi:arginyl-tRNA--protein-N-Asp/Glu arginylyltransferase
MYNQTPTLSIEESYSQGLLPQRNNKDYFYIDSSSRSNLKLFKLSSENRRILKKTDPFSFQTLNLADFSFSLDVQKIIFRWIKNLGWNFPMSSVKYVFGHHIFNRLYIWQDLENKIVAYSVCYFSKTISHIAYVFYNPDLSQNDLPIRLTLQAVIDSQKKGLNYCYLGRFDPSTKLGFYKRTLPGFEYFSQGLWLPYSS